jgi:hypothetical protein
MRISRLVIALPAALLALAFAALAVAGPARADILIAVDKSAQRMTVTVDGQPLYVWPVSTGAPGYDTPSGEFKPFRMEREHFSREWDDAPMPHSIFFTQQGHAIHGSNHVKAIGTPASHGCVRLEPRNAGILFDLVRQKKMANTRVVLTGETPASAGVPVARRDQGIMAEEDLTGSLPPKRQRQARGWQSYPGGEQRLYVDRERPAYAPRRYYGSQLPFGW